MRTELKVFIRKATFLSKLTNSLRCMIPSHSIIGQVMRRYYYYRAWIQLYGTFARLASRPTARLRRVASVVTTLIDMTLSIIGYTECIVVCPSVCLSVFNWSLCVCLFSWIPACIWRNWAGEGILLSGKCDYDRCQMPQRN